MNLYEVLEVSPNASKEVITSAYRALARRYHPDANQSGNTKQCEEKMKQLNMAYEILSDEFKRAEYNLSLGRQTSPQPEPKTQPRPEPQSRPQPKPGPQNQHQQTTYYRTVPNPAYEPPSKNVLFHLPWGSIIFIGIVVVGILIGVFGESSSESFDQPAISAPASGLIMMYTKGPDSSPLEIKTPAEETDYYIKLVRVGNSSPAMTIFVNGGDTVELDVPYGTYEMRYAAGTTWYGEEYLFGPSTQYSAMDDTFEFNDLGGWTVELIPQTNGNLTETTLDASEF